MSQQPFTLAVGDHAFEAPLRDVGGMRIAYLDFVSDTKLVSACAAAMADLLPSRSGAIVVPESGAIALGHALAGATSRPLVVLRKHQRNYMGSQISVPVQSVAAPNAEILIVEEVYLPTLRASDVSLVDTVTSSGATLRAMAELMRVAEVRVAETAVAFTEGDVMPPGILALGHLPIFPANPGGRQLPRNPR